MAKVFAWLMESKMPDPRAVVVETSVGKLVFQPETLEILEVGWPKWKIKESKIPPPSSFWRSSLDCHLELISSRKRKKASGAGKLRCRTDWSLLNKNHGLYKYSTWVVQGQKLQFECHKTNGSNLTSPKLLSRFTLFKRFPPIFLFPQKKGATTTNPPASGSPGHVHPNSHTSNSPW